MKQSTLLNARDLLRKIHIAHFMPRPNDNSAFEEALSALALELENDYLQNDLPDPWIRTDREIVVSVPTLELCYERTVTLQTEEPIEIRRVIFPQQNNPQIRLSEMVLGSKTVNLLLLQGKLFLRTTPLVFKLRNEEPGNQIVSFSIIGTVIEKREE